MFKACLKCNVYKTNVKINNESEHSVMIRTYDTYNEPVKIIYHNLNEEISIQMNAKEYYDVYVKGLRIFKHMNKRKLTLTRYIVDEFLNNSFLKMKVANGIQFINNSCHDIEIFLYDEYDSINTYHIKTIFLKKYCLKSIENRSMKNFNARVNVNDCIFLIKKGSVITYDGFKIHQITNLYS